MVELNINGDVDVPADTVAAVSNLSAIGEQRIDFRPRTDRGPYLRDGDVIEMADTAVPRRFDAIITHLGDVAARIDEDDLTTITSELGTGLDTEVDLATLGHDADRVLTMLERSLQRSPTSRGRRRRRFVRSPTRAMTCVRSRPTSTLSPRSSRRLILRSVVPCLDGGPHASPRRCHAGDHRTVDLHRDELERVRQARRRPTARIQALADLGTRPVLRDVGRDSRRIGPRAPVRKLRRQLRVRPASRQPVRRDPRPGPHRPAVHHRDAWCPAAWGAVRSPAPGRSRPLDPLPERQQMDFNLPDTAVAVREGVLRAMSGFDHAYWSRLEEEHRFPEEAWAALAEGGWLGLSVPEEFGGGGQGLLELAVANETLASTGATQGTFLYILTPGFGAMTITRHGTDEQKKEILPGLAAGDTQFCLALTEPDAGSNALAITTQARQDGDDFLITGQKIWISGVDRADWMVAITRTISAAEAKPRTAGFTAFLIDVKEALAAGTLTYQPIPKMGSNIVTSSQVFFDDVRVPAHRVIGEVNKGFAVLWDVLNPDASSRLPVAWARPTQRWTSPATTPASARCSAADRRQPGDPVPAGADQGQDRAGPTDDLQSCVAVRPGPPLRNETNVAKLTGAQVAWEAADQAFQTFGGMAYSKEFPIERLFRDARIGKNIPVAEELILAHIGTQMLHLPRATNGADAAQSQRDRRGPLESRVLDVEML